MPSIDLTSTHSLLIQLAQDKRASVVAKAQEIVQQANKMIQEGEGVLRAAVERVLLESLEELPKANVSIKNGEDGAPASLVWEDPAEEPDPAGDAADEGATDDLPAEPAADEAPKKPAASNGAPRPAARPQAAQRKAVAK